MFGRTEETKFMTDAIRRFVRDVGWVVLCVEVYTGISQPGGIRCARIFQPLTPVAEPALRPYPYACKTPSSQGPDKDSLQTRGNTPAAFGARASVAAWRFDTAGVRPDSPPGPARHFPAPS